MLIASSFSWKAGAPHVIKLLLLVIGTLASFNFVVNVAYANNNVDQFDSFFRNSLHNFDINPHTIDLHSKGDSSKEAYATIMYGGTPKDYEYFLGVRVMWQSLRKTGTTRDMLTLVTPDVDPMYRKVLTQEGSIVKEVDYVQNPYQSHSKYNDRFKFAMVKLMSWNQTEYDRVILLDADILVLSNIDHAFLCGNFCAVFVNPSIFHTGLVVLEPSASVFADMIEKLSQHLESYDGADQGFLNAYFPDMLSSPLFSGEELEKLSKDTNHSRLSGNYRLPFGYHLDHFYYYQRYVWQRDYSYEHRFRWEVYSSEIYAVGFPGVPALKPWNWYSYPLMSLSSLWNHYRLQLDLHVTDIIDRQQILLLVMLPGVLVVLILRILFTHLHRFVILWDGVVTMASVMLGSPDKSMEISFMVNQIVAHSCWILNAFFAVNFIIPKTATPFWGWTLFFEYVSLFSVPTMLTHYYWFFYKGCQRHGMPSYKDPLMRTLLLKTMLAVFIMFEAAGAFLYGLSVDNTFKVLSDKVTYALVGFAVVMGIHSLMYLKMASLWYNLGCYVRDTEELIKTHRN